MSGKNGKAQFYVFYLGWKECRGLWGREFVEPIIRELVFRRHAEDLPKLTIESTRKEMKITQLIQRKKKVEKLKYPPIPTKDITYTIQALAPDEDVVACIYLGYNPQTRAAVHVHVYRCDSDATASFFVDHLRQFIELPENKRRALKIEQELITKGQVIPMSTAYVDPSTRHGYDDGGDDYDDDDQYSDKCRPYYRSRENMAGDVTRNMAGGIPRDDPYQRGSYAREDYKSYDLDQRDPRAVRETRNSLESSMVIRTVDRHEPPLPSRGRDFGKDYGRDQEIYQSMTEELKAKLKGMTPAGQGPVLLPPKDYDTVHRNAGNLTAIQERMSTNTKLLGVEWSRKSDSDTSDRESFRNSYEDPYIRNEDSYKIWRGNRPPGPITRAARSPDPRSHWNSDIRRAASPEPRRSYAGGQRRGRSPTRTSGMQYNPLARAMSPPPGHELRNSYFPASDPLPNYLAQSDSNWSGQYSPRATSPSLSPNISRYGVGGGGSEEGGRHERKPKYTAANLGLVYGASRHSGGPRPRSDEGYLSMDRADPPFHGAEENPYGYVKPPTRDHLRDESPPPRAVIAGEQAHPELSQEISPDLPGSGQPFLY